MKGMAMSEVTMDEILSKYHVTLKKELTTGWVKDILLENAIGEKFEVRIYWDMDNGYTLAHNPSLPITKLPEQDRPEFEYILDSITEDQKIDKEAAAWAMSQY
jgi:hypothetical protein